MKTITLAVVLGTLAMGCKKKEEKPAATPPPVVLDAAPAAVDAAVAVIDAAPPPVTPAVPAGKVGVQILDLQYGGIVAQGLPAISEDGKQLAVTSVADDGGRGYLDLRLLLLDRVGTVTKEWTLADPDATSASDDQDNVAPAVLDKARAQTAEANAALAAITWRSLTPVTLPADADAEAPPPLVAGDYSFAYKAPKLSITKAGAKPLVKTYEQLTGQKPPKAPSGEDQCADSEYLKSVAVDAASKTALIEFDFTSGHNCGTGGQVYGVVTLP